MKGGRMRRVVHLLTALLVISIVLGTIGCGGKPSLASPEDTVREYHRAMEAKDKYRMANLLADSEQRRTLLRFTDFSGIDTIRVSALEIEIISESDNEAFVKVAEEVEINKSGEITTQHLGGTWHLVKQNDRWLIVTFQS